MVGIFSCIKKLLCLIWDIFKKSYAPSQQEPTITDFYAYIKISFSNVSESLCNELSLPEVSQIKKIKNKDDLCGAYHTTDSIDFGRLDIILRPDKFL